MYLKKQKLPSMQCFDKHYQGLGYCIFCLAEDVELNLEHIIPAAIGGRYFFHNATCSDCERIMNSSFETKAMQKDLLVPRLLMGLKKSTSKMPLIAIGEDIKKPNDEGFITQLANDEYPPVFNMMIIPQAGLISGVDQISGIGSMRIGLSHVTLGIKNKWRGGEVATKEPMMLGPLQMAIAKMAFAFALGEYGEDYFETQDIRDLILGKRNDVFQYVGGYLGRIEDKRYLHKMYFKPEKEYLTVIVHLFASCGGPPYQVVVGRYK